MAWGEIMTAVARIGGAVGAVIDGFHSDTKQVLAQKWIPFRCGAVVQDVAVAASRYPVKICAAEINSGDLVFADVYGPAHNGR